MRKLKLLITVLFVAIAAHASTNITTPTVSGHWTVAGSPYNIFNNITINAGMSLTIDPGVRLVFQGYYFVEIYGSLIAAGSATQPIMFTMQDTVGWSRDDSSTAGGWSGLEYYIYSGTAHDSSVFRYCDVEYLKNGDLYFARSISVSHCTFTNNKCTSRGHGGIISFYSPDSSVVHELDSCDIHDNTILNGTAINDFNSQVSFSIIHNTNIHDNTMGGGGSIVLSARNANLLFENNWVYNHGDVADSGFANLLNFSGGKVSCRANKIFNNQLFAEGVISAYGTNLDVRGNFICNNRTFQSFYGSGTACFESEGGAAMRIVYCSQVNIHENVIANNYAALAGGAIYLLGSSANIYNNQIVNNSGLYGGGITLVDADTTGLIAIIKNNLFFNNISTYSGISDTSNLCLYYYSNTVQYEHNFCQFGYHHDAERPVPRAYTFIGDTTTNVIGTNPGMIAPTLTASYTESALTANFNIAALSPCIDAGDTSGIGADSFDYVGNGRIVGTGIDIGAFEWHTEPGPLMTAQNDIDDNVKVYPNPAKDEVTVAWTKMISMLEVYDLTGRSIISQHCNDLIKTFNISGLAKGIYLLKINGTELRQFVKQ